MDSNYNRAYYVMVTYLWALFIAASFNYLTALTIFHPNPIATVEYLSLRDLTTNRDLKSDQANINFALSYDLTSEFNWNCKQLYFSVVAVYESPKKPRNEVTIYDLIIEDIDQAKTATVKELVNEYPIRDQFKETLLNAQVQLKVYVDRLPIFGFAETKLIAESATFVLPAEYKRLTRK